KILFGFSFGDNKSIFDGRPLDFDRHTVDALTTGILDMNKDVVLPMIFTWGKLADTHQGKVYIRGGGSRRGGYIGGCDRRSEGARGCTGGCGGENRGRRFGRRGGVGRCGSPGG